MVLYTFLLSKLKNDVNSQKAVDVENHWFWNEHVMRKDLKTKENNANKYAL